VAAGLNKNDCIRELVAHRLRSVAATELSQAPAGVHIDEDTIAAFVEGRLNDTECKPVLSHLAACGLCRRASAQFVQLENQIDDDVPATEEEPGRLEALLARLRDAVPAGSEEVVFAYENPSEVQSKSLPAQDEPDKPGDKNQD